MSWIVLVILALFGLAHTDANNEVDRVSLSTSLGRINGRLKTATATGVPYAAFEGIPYAEPPIGKLRFKPPVRIERWPDQRLDATSPPRECPQTPNMKLGESKKLLYGNEDCLFLNVYVPKTGIKENIKLPVMVFVHGGYFTTGHSRSDFYGPDYFMSTEQVILVTINYRLGPLGFLSTGDNVIPGNMALQDQLMALNWVKDNIANFHGDPNLVTVFGQGAGAKMISMLMTSPKASTLFQQAILQSGAVVDDPSMYLSEDSVYYASTFAQMVGCEAKDESSYILKCLQEKPLTKLMNNSLIFEKFLGTPNPWKPNVDDYMGAEAIIPMHPHEAFAKGRFMKIPVIIGTTEHEGSSFIHSLLSNHDLFDELAENFDILGPVALMQIDEHAVSDEDSSTANLLLLHYIDEQDDEGPFNRSDWKSLRQLYGDLRFRGPAHVQMDLMSGNSQKPIFHYNFRYKGSQTMTRWLNISADVPDMDDECGHGDDLFVLFHQEGIEKSSEDLAMSQTVVHMWTKFAQTSVPHADWHSINNVKGGGSNDFSYAVIDNRPLRMSLEDVYRRDMDFVTSMFHLITTYRNFDMEEHPAIQQLRKEKSEVDHDEL